MDIFELRRVPGDERCDFCSSAEVRWVYPARDFIANALGGNGKMLLSESKGAWAACNLCHDLIEAGARTGLALRSYHAPFAPEEFVLLRMFIPADELIIALRELQDQFFNSRCGPATPIFPDVYKPNGGTT